MELDSLKVFIKFLVLVVVSMMFMVEQAMVVEIAVITMEHFLG